MVDFKVLKLKISPAARVETPRPPSAELHIIIKSNINPPRPVFNLIWLFMDLWLLLFIAGLFLSPILILFFNLWTTCGFRNPLTDSNSTSKWEIHLLVFKIPQNANKEVWILKFELLRDDYEKEHVVYQLTVSKRSLPSPLEL